MLDNKANPFGRMVGANAQPVQGIMQVADPVPAQMSQEAGAGEQVSGMLQDKAMNMAVNKGTEMATGALSSAMAPAASAIPAGAGSLAAAAGSSAAPAAAAAGKGAGAAAGAGGAGLMAAAAPMAAPLLIGGLIASKLFK